MTITSPTNLQDLLRFGPQAYLDSAALQRWARNNGLPRAAAAIADIWAKIADGRGPLLFDEATLAPIRHAQATRRIFLQEMVKAGELELDNTACELSGVDYYQLVDHLDDAADLTPGNA